MGNVLRLFRYNLNDMVLSAGLVSDPEVFFGRILFFLPAMAFTLKMLSFDRKIVKTGLQKACYQLLKEYYQGFEYTGESLPEKGGLLVVSNHPGLGDSLAAISLIGREDLKIVALDKDFFQSLPGLHKKTIPVPEESAESPALMRGSLSAVFEMLSHLKKGGSLLLYPAGKIEPDPGIVKGGLLLKKWSRITGMLVQKAFQKGFSFQIALLEISHVFPEKSFSMPFVRWQKTSEDRDKSAALWVLLTAMTKKQKIKVRLNQKFFSNELAEKGSSAESIQKIILNAYERG